MAVAFAEAAGRYYAGAHRVILRFSPCFFFVSAEIYSSFFHKRRFWREYVENFQLESAR